MKTKETPKELPNIQEAVEALKHDGAVFTVVAGEIELRVPPTSKPPSPAVLDQLRANKDAVISYLTEEGTLSVWQSGRGYGCQTAKLTEDSVEAEYARRAQGRHPASLRGPSNRPDSLAWAAPSRHLPGADFLASQRDFPPVD